MIREQSTNPKDPSSGATAYQAECSVVLSGPGVSYNPRGQVLLDPAIRPLTGDQDDWDARVRADATHGWIVAQLAAQGVDAGGLFRTLWPNSRWSWGPLAAPSWLAGYIGRSRLEATASPYRLGRATLLAVQELRKNAASLSLAQSPVPGWCKRGHQLTDDNKSGDNCRRCRNATYRAKRAGISIDDALLREDQRHAA